MASEKRMDDDNSDGYDNESQVGCYSLQLVCLISWHRGKCNTGTFIDKQRDLKDENMAGDTGGKERRFLLQANIILEDKVWSSSQT